MLVVCFVVVCSWSWCCSVSILFSNFVSGLASFTRYNLCIWCFVCRTKFLPHVARAGCLALLASCLASKPLIRTFFWRPPSCTKMTLPKKWGRSFANANVDVGTAQFHRRVSTIQTTASKHLSVWPPIHHVVVFATCGLLQRMFPPSHSMDENSHANLHSNEPIQFQSLVK